jgi:uncharacterized protein
MTQTTTRIEPAKPVEPGAPPTLATRGSPGARRREHRFFVAMVGLVALHIADDSFLQPQPGTSAGDHLVSGLVPLAVLALAAVACQRLRPGGRAAIALLVGFFGIAFGIEAVYYTTKVGPSGDDFTGLLSLLAGTGLVGLGLVTLWRTRRREGGLLRRSLRRAAIGVAGFVVGFFILYPLGYAYVGTHVARPPVDDVELGSKNTEDVELHTSDGLTLEGSYVPSRNGAALRSAARAPRIQPGCWRATATVC